MEIRFHYYCMLYGMKQSLELKGGSFEPSLVVHI